MRSEVLWKRATIGGALALMGLPAALGQGQVNGSGASLFVDYFRQPAATNDFIDVDGDGNITLGGLFVDPLTLNNAASFGNIGPDPNSGETWWVFQYRSVGSVEGYNEFVDYQLCGNLPESIPSERGIINTLDFAVTGVVTWVGPPGSCADDTDNDGIANMSGTPVCQDSVDFANTDVQTSWATQGPPGIAAWNRTPASAGYGRNPGVSNGQPGQVGEANLLASLSRDCDGDGTIDIALNTNTSSPDALTVHDTTVAFSPVAAIMNRGVGARTNISYTDLQHALVTGRLASGENLAVAVRDVGSGTRNAFANTLGVDPSHAVGDHVGARINSATLTNLGPDHQVSNCGGSSIMENAVQQRRLAIGFTGLVGSSRAIQDAQSGRYEILDVIKNIDSDQNGQPDSLAPVRPKLSTVLYNDNPATGYQIGGLQTFATVGNPAANRDPADPLYDNIWPPMASQNTADFINNTVSSIVDFTDPNNIGQQSLTPGQFMAQQFFLEAAVAATPVQSDPSRFVANPNFVLGVQDYIILNSSLALPGNDTPAWGSVNHAGLVPVRALNPDKNHNGILDPNDVYSDGTDGSYYIAANGQHISSGTLAQRNAVCGDFNNDGARDWDDIPAMIAAVLNPRGFEAGVNHGGAAGSQSGDYAITEVLGDFNGDGDFDSEDIRYFADGLALNPSTGLLDRAAGFAAVDQAFGGNYFETALATGKAYVAGDSRGDIAGAGDPTPGAAPQGVDGLVDDKDIDYLAANFGDWGNLSDAAHIDLSCDMNGDLVVDSADGDALVEEILCTFYGDLDLDGDVDLSDLAIQLANYGTSGNGWSQGNIDWSPDGTVGLASLSILLSNYGANSGCP